MTDNKYQFETYNPNMKNEWDQFIQNARNATFLSKRTFMDYHKHKFEDHSIYVTKSNKIVALLPAHIVKNTLHTHQGLTYAGFALAQTLHGNQTLEMFQQFKKWLQKEGFKQMTYKPTPHIYHNNPAEDELYALHTIGAKISSRTLSATLSPIQNPTYNSLRKRGIKKAKANQIECQQTNQWHTFWQILTENLQAKHQTNPVHNINEITTLSNQLPENIKLYTAQLNQKTVAGVVIFETNNCAHAQYIAASEEGKKTCALDLLFDHLIRTTYAHKTWFDFGISTENAGTILNENLLLQKEGFGARGIVYDTYELNL